MNRTLLVWFAFLGVFAAGAVTGGVVTQRMSRTFVQRRASEQFTEQQFKRVADQIDLTDEQRARIRPIITTAAGEIQQRRRANFATLEKMESDIRAQLTDAQVTKFDQLRIRQHENERALQRWLREQRRHRLDMLTSPDARSSQSTTSNSAITQPQASAPSAEPSAK